MLPATLRPRLRQSILAFMLALHAGLLADGAARHSPTFDEPGHLVAGISHWKFGRFELYSVNPPLVRTIAALPVLLYCDPILDWSDYVPDPHRRTEVLIGRDLVARNGLDSIWLFTLARWVCIPFSLLGAWFCECWSRARYGDLAGLVSASVWCLSPMILGNGQLITPDVPAASLGIAAFFAFRGWLRSASWSSAVLAGVIGGLALLTKSTWILLVPLWSLLWLIWRISDRTLIARQTLAQFGQLALAFFCALLILNAFYAFRGTGARLGSYRFISSSLAGDDAPVSTDGKGNRFEGTAMGRLMMPLPGDFVLGLDVQKRDFERGLTDRAWRSYFGGEWKHGGWWYFYLAAASIKEPIGLWLLLGIAFFVRVSCAPRSSVEFREDLLLLVPVACLVLIATSQVGMHRYLRYLLPAWPFLIIWTGQAANTLTTRARSRWGAIVVSVGWAWMASASLSNHPHSLSYFNELAGGPANGGRFLVDSNLDWGQDLLGLRHWLDRHPEAKPLHLAYFGSIDPRDLGIEYQLPPIADEQPPQLSPGWYAVSVSYVYGHPMPVPDGSGDRRIFPDPAFAYFESMKPTERIGYSINLYRVPEKQIVLSDADH